MRSGTRSQCKSINNGVTWSNLRAPVVRRAAAWLLPSRRTKDAVSCGGWSAAHVVEYLTYLRSRPVVCTLLCSEQWAPSAQLCSNTSVFDLVPRCRVSWYQVSRFQRPCTIHHVIKSSLQRPCQSIIAPAIKNTTIVTGALYGCSGALELLLQVADPNS